MLCEELVIRPVGGHDGWSRAARALQRVLHCGAGRGRGDERCVKATSRHWLGGNHISCCTWKNKEREKSSNGMWCCGCTEPTSDMRHDEVHRPTWTDIYLDPHTDLSERPHARGLEPLRHPASHTSSCQVLSMLGSEIGTESSLRHHRQRLPSWAQLTLSPSLQCH